MSLFRRAFKLALVCTTALVPTAALADPISLIVAVGVAAIQGATVAAIATLVLTAALTYGLSLAVNALFGPKQRQQERQASVLALNIGEVPREAILGREMTGGSLIDAFNYGGTYGTDWEVLMIAVADHKCASLEGFYVNDTYVAFGGDGAVSGYNSQLVVYWLDGSASQTLPSIVTNGGWSTTGSLGGIALVVVAYKADDPQSTSPVWSGGRPSFKWLVKGKLCYDPRKDSTVGGSGTHRWATPSTWEWTDNLAIVRYNWVRGIYAKDQVGSTDMLLVGRGLTSLEAPEAHVFAYANLCDENVALAAGGTIKRYTFNGVVRADEQYVSVERKFAECCAGTILQVEGAVEVEPGYARSVTASFTDDDIVVGTQVNWSNWRGASDSQWVNTVVPRYKEPTQQWQDHAAPVRRVTGDLATDKGPREQTLSLSGGVIYDNQAGRVGEISRRLGRLVSTGSVTLPPRFAGITEGDWVQWTSARRFAGATRTFRVEAYSLDEKWRNTLQLREIASSCYAWSTGDELTPGSTATDQTAPTGARMRGYDQVDFAAQVYGAAKPDNNATRNVSAGTHSTSNSYLKGDFVRDAAGTTTYIAKSNVPTGIALTNTVYWDVFVVGSGGTAGANAFNAVLQPASIVISTAADGSGGDYSGATGTLKLYEGTVNRTASATFAVVGSPSWASINASGVFTITDPGADQAAVQFDVSYSGSTYRVTLTTAKAKRGATGAAGTNGAPGTNGTNGATYYTWIAYADAPDGSVNFTTGTPGGRAFIGIAANQTTATEGATASAYDWSPYKGPPAFGLVASGNVVLASNRIIATSGLTGWGSGSAYSSESYTGGAQVTWSPDQSGGKNLMVGLNDDPTTDNSYTSLDYAWFATASSGLRIYESGTDLGSFGSYVAGDVLTVHYDNSAVRYLKNGVIVRTVPATGGRTFFLDSSFNEPAAAATIKSFSAAGAVGASSFTMIDIANTVIASPTSVMKVSGSSGAWDGKAQTREGYAGGSTISITAPSDGNPYGLGLTTDPAANASYDSVDYWMFLNGAGLLGLYLNGAAQGSIGSYTGGDRLTVESNGSVLRFYKNGSLLTTATAASSTETLYGVVNIPYNGTSITGISFGSAGSNGTNGTNGTNGANGANGLSIAATKPLISVQAASGGAALAGQLPRVTQMIVYDGFTDVTASVTYSKTQTNCSVTNDGGGQFTVTGVSAGGGFFIVTATYGARSISMTIPVAISEKGQGAISATPVGITALTTSSTFVVCATLADLSVPDGATLSGAMTVAYGPTSGGNYQAQVKLTYQNITDGGAETDFSGSTATGGTATSVDPDFATTSGSVVNSAGGTKTFRVRAYARRSAGSGSVSGSVSGNLSGGVS